MWKVNIAQSVALILFGIALALISLLSARMNLHKSMAIAIPVMSIVFFVFYMQIQKWLTTEKNNDQNEGHIAVSRNLHPVNFILICLILSILISFVRIYRLPDIKFDEKSGLTINGIFGMNKKLRDLIVIDTVSELPSVKETCHGIKLFNIKKGRFRTGNEEYAELFTYGNAAPYIYIEYRRSNKLYINFKDSDKTMKMYRTMRISKDTGEQP